jgi:tRNA A-37 threonylcarbamoyl transferase component Bud32
VSADAPDGLCPECLLRHAIDGRPEEPEGGTARWSPSPGFVPPAPAELGRHFPQLEVLELLGQGGMGAVYKARQTKLDRLVAIKVLPPEVARDPAFAERFVREARSLARLNHPNIVTVHDFGDAGGLYHFTMEYVDGRNLRDLLQGGPLPAAQALEIVPQICDALQYAHDEGLIHRDIKPENVLLDRKGRVTIADFGLAKLVGLTPAYLTLTGTQEVMGTLLYMAPEQMKQARTVDHRADIYSLGVVLYEMVTGELPLGRFAPPSHKAAVGERLDQVVLRALAREPAERYQDARAFKQDVEAALAAQPGAGGPQVTAPGRRAWPSARFQMLSAHEGNHVVAGGMVSRDDEALILEFESAKRKYKSFFKEPGQPQAVRIPLQQVASLSYGWGWGKPPRSLILKVTRLSALAGMPGNSQGRARFLIPREDRDEARALVESIMGPAFPDPKQGSAGPLSSVEQARQVVKPPAVGLLATGVLGLVWWVAFALLLLQSQRPDFWLLVLTLGSLFAGGAAVQIGGAVAMLRLRGYPWAGAAAILATIPWSPIWVLGLPFGTWAIVVLGKPAVAEAFLGDKRQAESGPADARSPGVGIASRFLSLCRSFGRYLLPTMLVRKTTTGDWSGESPQPTANLVPRPGASDSGEGP